MSKYKVLPVPMFFENILWFSTSFVIDDDTPVLSEEEGMPLAIEQLREERMEQTEPVFNRDGWYYDRLEKKCWYEWRGTAWLADRAQFEYELSQHEARILEPDEIKAIKTLMVYGSCPMELKHLLWKHEQKCMMRDIYREGTLHRIRLIADTH